MNFQQALEQAHSSSDAVLIQSWGVGWNGWISYYGSQPQTAWITTPDGPADNESAVILLWEYNAHQPGLQKITRRSHKPSKEIRIGHGQLKEKARQAWSEKQTKGQTL